MNFCTTCGARLVASGRFCTSCGAALAVSATGRDAPPAAATEVEEAVTTEQPPPLWQIDDADARPARPPREPGGRGVLVPVVVAVVALLAVAAAFVVHRTYGDATAATTPKHPGKTSAGSAVGSTPPGDETDQSPSATAARNPVLGTAEPGLAPGEHDVAPLADITAPPSARGHVDDSGRTATYPATAMVDTDPSTAWRMNGDGTGQTITLSFERPVTVTGFALDPGFDKVGVNREDRWPENRRIAAATFSTDDGSAFAVEFATDASLPASERLQTFMLPAPVTTTTISVHIDATQPAERGTFDTTAISRLAVLGS